MRSTAAWHVPEGQIDARVGHSQAARQTVLPVLLRRAAHDQQTAVRERYVVLVDNFAGGGPATPHDKVARRTEADAGNYWFAAQLGLVVGMPPHVIAAVAVKIGEH